MTDWDSAEPYLWAAERFGWSAQQVDEDPLWLFARRRRYAAELDLAKRGR